MSQQRRHPWIRLYSLLIILFLLVMIPMGRVALADQGIFSPMPAGRAAGAFDPIPYYATRVRYVDVDTARLADSQVVLNLFEDLVFTATNRRVKTSSNGTAWFGSLPSVAHGQAILIERNGRITGNVRAGGELYQIRPLKNGGHAIYEVDQTEFPPEFCPDHGEHDVPLSPFPDYPMENDLPDPATADSGALLDVMVVYTSAAAAASSDILGEIQLAVAETNQSYEDSGVVPRIRLVHTVETSYAGSGDLSTDNNRLTHPSDGYMDEVHTLRDQYAADMVVLIQENGGGYCGKAQSIMAMEFTAFAVVARDCATGYYSFGHELGHLQGARHDRYVDLLGSPYVYGHGWVNVEDRWRSVMSYNDKCSAAGTSCTRLPYWSNTSFLLNGDPMGSAQYEDNARVLNTTAHTIANFRQENSLLYDQTPATYSEIPKKLSFTVNSSQWAGVAIAPASDHNLQADDDEACDSPYADSTQSGTARDFITSNGSYWGNATHYVRIYNGSSDSYGIESDSTAYQVNPGASTSTSLSASNLLRMFQTNLTTGNTYRITLDVTGGSGDLSLYVFNPSRSSGHRGDYDWNRNAGGAGISETLTLTPTQSGVHGIAVINENGQAVAFDIAVCQPAVFYRDADGDGYGDAGISIQACSAPAGYVADNTDCNDANASIHPNATEACNGIDDNCNTQVDENLTFTTYYRDLDGDGYGNPSDSTLACAPPAGFVTDNTDCDDTAATVHPNAGEACNGIDDNCDSLIDNDVTVFTYYRDADEDGYGDLTKTTLNCNLPVGYASNSLDCDDSNPAKNPDATESCNGLDDNCNGIVDEGCSTASNSYSSWQLLLDK